MYAIVYRHFSLFHLHVYMLHICVVMPIDCISHTVSLKGLFNFDEDLNLEPATEEVDFAPFPHSSDDDETSTDGKWCPIMYSTVYLIHNNTSYVHAYTIVVLHNIT